MEHQAPPTRARYVVILLLSTLAFVLYLDRVCISKAAIDIQKEFGFSETEFGWILGAFTIAYGLFEVPTGRLGDRYGSRGVLTRIVLWWSVFTALTGCIPNFQFGSSWSLNLLGWQFAVPPLISSLGLFLLVRFLFGAGEAGALPNTARVVASWIPASERGWGQAMILTSMQVGGMAAPVLATYLIKFVGWRWTFGIFGSLGVLWGAWFYFWYRDSPAEHPDTNEAERELIAAGCTGASGTPHHGALPWLQVLTSLNVWMLGMIMVAAAGAMYLYIGWFPSYLVKARGVESDASGWLTSMVLAGGAIGAFCGGPVSSAVVQWTGEIRITRSLLGSVLVGLAGFCIFLSVKCDSPVYACLCVAGASFCGQAQLSNWWAATIAISGQHLGALFGLLNSLGVPGAFASQVFLGMFADYRKAQGFVGRDQWDPAFYIYAGMFALASIAWLLVDSTKPIVREEPAA
ncbi:MAG: MFS transporter [Planctomycetes bacterium]|nr:MFS transporter [Planctomycetota bacterium]